MTAPKLNTVDPWIIDGMRTFINTFMPSRINFRIYPFPGCLSFQVLCNLKRECFVEDDLEHLFYGYGNRPNVPLAVFGLVTSIPGEGESEFDPLKEFDSTVESSERVSFERAFRGVFGGMEGMEAMFRVLSLPECNGASDSRLQVFCGTGRLTTACTRRPPGRRTAAAGDAGSFCGPRMPRKGGSTVAALLLLIVALQATPPAKSAAPHPAQAGPPSCPLGEECDARLYLSATEVTGFNRTYAEFDEKRAEKDWQWKDVDPLGLLTPAENRRRRRELFLLEVLGERDAGNRWTDGGTGRFSARAGKAASRFNGLGFAHRAQAHRSLHRGLR